MGETKSDTDPSPGGGKRKRAPNFTEKEIKILMKLVFAHIDIIECKKTDSETWRVKDIVWNNVAENFNNCSGTTKRTVETVRQKYDSVKKLARKKDAKNKEEEGKPNPDFIDMEDYERELLRVLELVGNNNGSTYEPSNSLLTESDFGTIKLETSNTSHTSNIEQEELREEERFTITDEDMLWDLPTDTVNRPRLNFLKKQMEQSERDEERLIIEHKYRMRTLQIKRRVMLNKEKRLRTEHKKRMELLDLELELKKRVLEREDRNNLVI